MKTQFIKVALVLSGLLLADTTWAQNNTQEFTIPLSNPGEQLKLEISIMSAHIEVIGEDREDAFFSIDVSGNERKIVTPSGPQSIAGASYSMEIEEQANHISIDMDWRANQVKIIAHIPKNADLELATVNNGSIVVSNISGNLELNNVNGPITATNITGSVIAESINDDIHISLSSIDADTVTALTSINGNFVLGLPADAAVQLQIDSAEGEIISEFEVEVVPSKPVIKQHKGKRGVEVTVENAITVNINGGGSVIRLKTLNGNVEIQKSDS